MTKLKYIRMIDKQPIPGNEYLIAGGNVPRPIIAVFKPMENLFNPWRGPIDYETKNYTWWDAEFYMEVPKP